MLAAWCFLFGVCFVGLLAVRVCGLVLLSRARRIDAELAAGLIFPLLSDFSGNRASVVKRRAVSGVVPSLGPPNP